MDAQGPRDEDLTYTITEARTRLGEVVNRARYSGRPVRLTNHGQTAAWIISDETMERIRQLDAAARDAADLAEVTALAASHDGQWIPHGDVAAMLAAGDAAPDA